MQSPCPVKGIENITKVIQASSRADHDIPVFAMTANSFANDRRSCREVGMTGYIAKPVSVKDIENALTEIEDKQKTGLKGANVHFPGPVL